MKVLLFLCLLGVLACLGSARRGSISNDLFQDDVNDEPVDEYGGVGGSEEEEQGGRQNPCNRKKCYRGEMCTINDQAEAECVCRNDCERFREQGDRHKVCSNKNDTYPSECDLDRDHCLCKQGLEGCSRPGTKKIQLEYYGVCKETTQCLDYQMAQFPKRMRDWLFIVMEVLERRRALEDYEPLMEEARIDANHSVAAIWKFCDLDKDPQDRSVSRRELQYTVRTLRGLEHCLVPFLDDCDQDDNREITLKEWGHCLGVEEQKITNRCVNIKKSKKDRRRK